jgi:salicylate hydroxylase
LRTVIIVGAGIGGLTAALAIARRGFEVAVFDQAQRLEEAGAGIQLSPNASRILLALGLRDQLQRHVVTPEELRVIDARTARVLARAPLGAAAERRYGAPYWVIHRGDLQAVLVEAVHARPGIGLHLGARVEDFTLTETGVTISARSAQGDFEHRGAALIGADGLWSNLRRSLGDGREPRFAGHSAWRALAPAEAVVPALRTPAVNLWLGGGAHLVHYPVRGGSLVNVVAIIRDDWREAGWSAPAERADILARYPTATWSATARALLAAPPHWQKWALYDRAPLAQRLAEARDNPAAAMRGYERQRRSRTARAQRAARRNGTIYQLGGPAASLRSLALTAVGGARLLTRYDWLYGWTPA